MRSQGSKARADLRLAIEALPRQARVAMLSGIETNPIIAGGYSNRHGICPMLAAHRAGGRSNVIGFALAWDRFAFGRAGRARPRVATERELLILKLYLQASLLASPVPAEQVQAGQVRVVETGTPATESAHRWSWPHAERDYDDFERALAQLLEAEEPGAAVELEPAL